MIKMYRGGQFFCLLLFLWGTLAARVLIITHNYNRPEFIEIQQKTFKKFLLDEYEFVVFNDARDEETARQIQTACSSYGIGCVRVSQEIHTRPYLARKPHDNLHQSNIRHANCVQYSLDVLGFRHDDVVLILDSDMFLIRPFSVSVYMHDKGIAAFIKRTPSKVYCLCPVLTFLAMNKLPEKTTLDFNTGTIDGWPVDSGGYTYHYLRQHPEVKMQGIDVLYSHQLFLADLHINRFNPDPVPNEVKATFYMNLGFNDKEINFLLKKPDTFEFYLDKNFLHYRDGSNDTHQSREYHLNKLRMFKEFIDDIVKS